MSRFHAAVVRGYAWVQSTRLGQAWSRYSTARGNVLAGGIAYFAFFSLFPALALGFTMAGYLMGGRPDLQRSVVQYVNRTLGGDLVGTTSGHGLVQLDDLVQHHVLTVTGVAGLLILLASGLGWLDAMRQGIRAMFGSPALKGWWQTKLRDLGVLVTLGLAVLISAGSSLLVTAAMGVVLDLLGLSRTATTSAVVAAVSGLVLMGVDFAIFLLLFRVLAGVRVPIADLVTGAWIGALGMGLLTLGGSYLLHRLASNRFLAASSVIVGLLLWLDIVGRLTLVAAAWAADRAADRGHLPVVLSEGGVPGVPTAVQGVGAAADAQVGRGRADLAAGQVRAVTLAAGVVLGVTGVLALGVTRRAAHVALATLRRP